MRLSDLEERFGLLFCQAVPETLEFLLRYYRGEALVELMRLRQVFRGGDLALSLGSPRGGRPGLTDSVRSADKLLEAAEAAGWLERGQVERIVELAFFGVGGFPGGARTASYPVEYAWTVRHPLPWIDNRFF